MYAWIWRRLPFGLRGKLAGSFVLLGIVGALLWYVIFPWAEPLLPFDDVQVGDPDSGYSQLEDPFEIPGAPSGEPDDHEIPYETGDTPEPSSSTAR